MIEMTNGLNTTQEINKRRNALIEEVFGFRFDRWYALNVWDDHYECYGITENDVMLANVSVFKMQLLINGAKREFLQFGSVATKKEYRGRGLSRRIMEYVLELYPDTPAFLFGNDSVLEFYPKFGFHPIPEKQPYVECQLENNGAMVRLDLSDTKINKYLRSRGQFSGILDCANQYSVNLFHLHYGHGDHIYEIPELGVMLMAEQYEDTLVLYDLVAPKPVCFTELKSHLCFPGVERIHFGFNPDWLEVDYQMKDLVIEDSTMMVKGDLGVTRDCIVPMLIRT